MRYLKHSLVTIPAAIAFALVSTSAMAGGATTVNLGSNDNYQNYLVDDAGASLYLFEADENGQSTCYGECAEEWPPLIATGEAKAGDGVDASKLDTTKRKNGDLQVRYDGHPLYYYEDDEKPGQANGQDIEDAGAEWYLLHADGVRVGHEDEREG